MRYVTVSLGCLLAAYGAAETLASHNAGLHELLCQWQACWDPASSEDTYQKFLNGTTGPADSIQALRGELIHDPASGYRWGDFAEAVLDSGDEAKARYCMRRAVALAPYSAPTMLRAATLNFRVGAASEALQLLRRILTITPDYDASTFSLFDRFGPGIDVVLDKGLPAEKRPAQAFFRHVVGVNKSPEDINKTWHWMAARSLVDKGLASDYVKYLVSSRQYEGAVAAWIDVAGNERGDYMRPNRVFNGDFEFDPTGAILDWTIATTTSVQADWDQSERHSGTRSLRLAFNGQENVSFHHVFQEAIVTPGRYQFEAFAKSKEISTDQGVSFHIFDAENPSRLNVSTNALMDSVDWSRQVVTFVVSNQTRLVRIELRRLSSGRLDNKMSGVFWADTVSLHPVH